MLNPDQVVYLNGEFLALEDARVSVLDRGFIYGDGVYEVIPVYSRQPFRMPHHLRRLQYSLDGIRLGNPHTEAQWETLVRELIVKQPFADQALYLQITRGVAIRFRFRRVIKSTTASRSSPPKTIAGIAAI